MSSLKKGEFDVLETNRLDCGRAICRCATGAYHEGEAQTITTAAEAVEMTSSASSNIREERG